jgi:hypothetical protein
MNVCPACGRPPDTEDQRFCRACGTRLHPWIDADAQQASAAGRDGIRPSRSAVALPSAVAACVVVLAVLASMALQSLWAYGDSVSGAEPSGDSTATPTTPVSTGPEQTPNRSADEVNALLAHIPLLVAATCRKETHPDELAAGLVVAVGCLPPGFPDPDKIVYLQYESPAAMQAAYDHIVTAIAPGLPGDEGCGSEGGRGSWSRGGVMVGNYACYGTASTSEWNSAATSAWSSDSVRMWWTDDEDAILALATDSDMSVDQIWTWFLQSETGPV